MAYLSLAVSAVAEIGKCVKTSSVYETAPVGFTEQNNFYNSVIQICTSFTPENLMAWIFQTEQKAGRRRSFRYAPRTLDIDIIFYDQEIIHRDNLHIPHPAYTRRRFVLEPLCEIAPDWICPVYHQPVHELLRRCEDSSLIQCLNIPLDSLCAITVTENPNPVKSC